MRGGVGEGNCAAGFGVCCVFSSTCNEETSQNTTYFSSPSTIPAVLVLYRQVNIWFGVCCVFSSTCNKETSQNTTYFSSPSTIPAVCSLMIRPLNDNICQVRLNFLTLNLEDPDISGFCRNDYLQVTGGVSQSGKIPTICGSNNGQHVIYSSVANFPARLSIVVNTQTSTAR
ncbi:uncharacterized protein LOC111701897 [Eurytemora carolleeae]|uniref:uncharacterized protein LOC111701897 n=1 Tax=Eurytemora carolleeae TaxID=1294199 RepID=UPI000C79365F|nr:uncharacterized protein LOC111701897 [Eurytemora carolleeae]|eukprot:XP_023329143.1 uncharacterized protein LOC111701897 [Eurytemora affinis]